MIDRNTLGAIIDLGLMATGHDLLMENSYEGSQAVARGITCCPEGEWASPGPIQVLIEQHETRVPASFLKAGEGDQPIVRPEPET